MHQIPDPPSKEEWAVLLRKPVRPVASLDQKSIPDQPGVYLCRRDGAAVYVGTASNLRARLWGKHLGAGLSLAGSSLRRNVGELLLGVPPAVTSSPNRVKVTSPQAEAIHSWLLSCDLAWQACETAAQAKLLERRLRDAYLPLLNRI
ncbi:GIY-YIG nuclease family protein [Rathayibacter caricis]|uniref:GIY-YIG nuclease family protein n=1 Tax=Rathayibacter caricis TaxID=110936 RepID=UPI0031455EDD